MKVVILTKKYDGEGGIEIMEVFYLKSLSYNNLERCFKEKESGEIPNSYQITELLERSSVDLGLKSYFLERYNVK